MASDGWGRPPRTSWGSGISGTGASAGAGRGSQSSGRPGNGTSARAIAADRKRRTDDTDLPVDENPTSPKRPKLLHQGSSGRLFEHKEGKEGKRSEAGAGAGAGSGSGSGSGSSSSSSSRGDSKRGSNGTASAASGGSAYSTPAYRFGAGSGSGSGARAAGSGRQMDTSSDDDLERALLASVAEVSEAEAREQAIYEEALQLAYEQSRNNNANEITTGTVRYRDDSEYVSGFRETLPPCPVCGTGVTCVHRIQQRVMWASDKHSR